MFRRAIPVLRVANSRVAEQFYCDGLGFKRRFAYRPDDPNADPCYMGLERDGVILHVSSFLGDGVMGGVASFIVDDVDALHREFVERCVPIDLTPTNQSWDNREMYVVDRDGNSIRFVQGKKEHSSKTASERASPEAATKNLASISPFFIVKDLQASISHYIERFGFTLDFQGPPDDVYYGQVSRDGMGIMLKAILPDVLPRPNHTRHEWARWDAYIYTLDPDALFNEFKQRGASFVKELCFIDDGLWGFEVTDADGYVLAFFRLRNQ